MRAVTTTTAAAIIGMRPKAFSNMIARIQAPELPVGRQGLERRIPVTLLPRLLLTAELAQRLGLPFWDAYSLADRLGRGEDAAGPFLRVQADLGLVQREIDEQLEAVIETVVRPRRGRPRGKPAAVEGASRSRRAPHPGARG